MFVKALLEKFIKPMIDFVLSNPGNNPLDGFNTTPQDITIGKESVTVKQGTKDTPVKCYKCDKIFGNLKGFSIHNGKVHTLKLNPNPKRKRSELDEKNKDFSCDFCDYHGENSVALKWHKGSCMKRQEDFHASRGVTPANKKAMRKVSTSANITPVNIVAEEEPVQLVSQPKAAEEVVAQNKLDDCMDAIEENQCDKCNLKYKDVYTLKQHKRDEHRELSLSVTPPPKKEGTLRKILKKKLN